MARQTMIQAEKLYKQTGLLKRLARAMGIQEGEGLAFSLLFGQSFLFGIAYITYYSSANALFLSVYSAQQMPYVYIIAAAIIIAVGLIFLRLQSSMPFSILLISNLGLLSFTIILLRLLLDLSSGGWVYFALIVWIRVLWVLGNLGLWTLAGRLFTSQQGKRLFSLILAGGVLSIIMVGFINSSLIKWLGTANLLWITSVSALAALLLLIITTRQFRVEMAAPPKVQTNEQINRQGKSQSIFRDKYILSICFFTAFSTIGTYVLDYAFVGQASLQMNDANQLSVFFGSYLGISTLVMLVVLLLISNRFFKRFGVRGGLLIDPILVAVGSLAVILLAVFPETATAIFWVVVATKMSDEVTVVAMNTTSVRIMYQPLSLNLRSQVQTVIESVIAPLSMGISGILLLLFTTLWDLTPLEAFYILAVILVIWLGGGIFLGRQYYDALRKALKKRHLDGTEFDIYEEGTGLEILEKYVLGDNHREALFAIEMLGKNNPDALEVLLPKLLTHENLHVRMTAIQLIDSQDEDILYKLEELVKDETQPTAVRAAALQKIGKRGHGILMPFLDDPDLEIRKAAVVGAFNSNSLEGILAAGEILIAVQNDTSVEMRCLAAQVMGKVGNSWFYRNLLPLLNDEDVNVRKEALTACRTVHHPQLWPLVIDALQSISTRPAASLALIEGGVNALPFIADALHQNDSCITAKTLIRICGKIGGPEVNNILLQFISTPYERVRSDVLHTLVLNQFQANEDTRSLIIRQIDNEIIVLSHLSYTAGGLENHSAISVQPLRNMLEQMIARGRLRILDLLAFIFNSQDIMNVRLNLLSDQKEDCANAVEIMDVMFSQSPKLREGVIPILSAQSIADLGKETQKHYPISPDRLNEELQSFYHKDDSQLKNDWLSVCVLYALPELDPDAAGEILESALQHPQNMIRQTAQGIMQKYKKTDGGSLMMLAIEKVLILKTVSIFSETPDDILAELAQYLEEKTVNPGQTIFEKGQPGKTMYIIVSGKVRVHDGEHTINELNDRDVFGEMALLDPAPRSASVTAIDETLLLCLDHDPFFEAVDTRSEISHGVIKVLSRNLRNMIENI